MSPIGGSRDAPVHSHFQLVFRQHVLPHDHREPGQGLEAVVRDVPRLQDGRLADVLHLADAHKHEQDQVAQSQVTEERKNFKIFIPISVLFCCFRCTLICTDDPVVSIRERKLLNIFVNLVIQT